MSNLIVLMYHSIYSTDAEYIDISDEDKPYAIHSTLFEEHVKWLLKCQYNIVDPNLMQSHSPSGINVLLTFDDGHIGFYRYAYPILCKYKLSAIFFITTDFIGTRKEFCTWDQLNDMSLNNMIIQSHGKTHAFISDMSEHDMSIELSISKKVIESNTHSKVWSLSFPGGRYIPSSIEVAINNGYTHYFTSEVKGNTTDALLGGLIGRFAIKSNTSVKYLQEFIEPSISTLLKRKLITIIKYSLKCILGNYGYHRLYKIINKAK